MFEYETSDADFSRKPKIKSSPIDSKRFFYERETDQVLSWPSKKEKTAPPYSDLIGWSITLIDYTTKFLNLSSISRPSKPIALALLTLKTFDSSVDAHLLKTKLSNEGIVSFLFDENIMTLNPLYNIMVGGIKLKVLEDDFERATKIVDEIETSPHLDENGGTLVCPVCGSDKLFQGFKSMKGFAGALSATLAVLLTVFPVYFSSAYRCKNCGNEFSKK